MKRVTRKEFVALGGALGAALSVGVAFPKVAVAGTPDAIDEVWSDPASDTTIVAAARSLGTAPVRLEVSESSDFAASTFHPAQDVSPNAQGYAKVTVTGLKPNTQYYYRWRSNGALAARAKGKCKTLATPGAPTSFAFISQPVNSTEEGLTVATEASVLLTAATSFLSLVRLQPFLPSPLVSSTRRLTVPFAPPAVRLVVSTLESIVGSRLL